VRWKVAAARQTAPTQVSVLERRVDSIHLAGVPARKAIEKIQELSGVKLQPQWPAMERSYVSPDEKSGSTLMMLPLNRFCWH